VRATDGGGVRFEPPTVGRATLARPRLAACLRAWRHVPVTVIAAPAGFGKTTALAQLAADERLRTSAAPHWLTCRPDDSTASGLLDGLWRAMRLPGRSPAGDAAVAAVADAMWHRSPDDAALLLDDVHEVAAGSPGAALLGALVDALPGNGHLVLCGRPPLPVPLARAEVAGRILRLGPDDLLFTADELRAFASCRGVPGERLAGTGGWPALAEIAASAPAGSAEPSTSSGAPRPPGSAPDSTPGGLEAAYLWEEVLSRLRATRQRDLAVLAHVGPFDEALAAAALGRPADPAAITAGLPLVGRTAGGGWTIHALWRPHLAGLVGEDELAASRRRAGQALAEVGDLVAATRLLADAGAWADVSGVVIGALGAAGQPVPGDVVASWLGRLPDAMQGGRVARLLEAVEAAPTAPGVAAGRLAQAAAAFGAEGELAGELACLSQLGQLAWWWELPDEMGAVVGRVLELDAEGHEEARPLACLARALIADVANDCATALAELDRIPPGSFGRAWRCVVDWLRSTSLNHLGHPAEALEAADRAAANAGQLVYAPLVETARLQAAWFLGRVDDVADAFPGVVERAGATGLRTYQAILAASCCAVLAWAGRPAAAARFLEQARGAAASRDIPLVDVNLVIAEATLAVAEGDDARAAALLDGYLGRAPLLSGHAAAPQQRTLALWYVLAPETRATWDAADLGPTFVRARTLAQALVAARAGTRRRAAATAVGPDAVRAHLPAPWATELALTESAEASAPGWAVLDALWPDAQPHVRRQARAGALRRPARAVLARLPVPPAGRLDLRLLGPVELRRDGALVGAPEWQRERVRSLLVHLALGRSVSRERLAADLWPALDTESQSRNLRVTLTHLLRALEPGRQERDASFLVRTHGDQLVLHDGPELGTDLWRFDRLGEAATEADDRGSPSAALGPMCEAVGLWAGGPAGVALGDDALAALEERRIRLVALATRAAELLLAKGQPDEARRTAEVALHADPWAERAHNLVVAAHVDVGDRRRAHRALARYRASLHELGLGPAEVGYAVDALARSAQLHPA
jgi:LuxR family maltose regulon positive regulatory protein